MSAAIALMRIWGGGEAVKKSGSQGRAGAAHVNTKQAKALPKTAAAAVCAQWVRCGKPGCRCARGERHGPYHYVFRRQGGRLRKRYVRQADVATVQAQAQRRRERARRAREQRVAWRQQWRALLAGIREMERHEHE